MHTLRYDAGAGAYDRLTGRWSRMYVDHVLDAAGAHEGSRVLDVATGTGDAAIAAADRVAMVPGVTLRPRSSLQCERRQALDALTRILALPSIATDRCSPCRSGS
jgi:predicted RNA methylase